nr:uncharacterized protein LOC119161705 [Rhipicephalus microplus]
MHSFHATTERNRRSIHKTEPLCAAQNAVCTESCSASHIPLHLKQLQMKKGTTQDGSTWLNPYLTVNLLKERNCCEKRAFVADYGRKAPRRDTSPLQAIPYWPVLGAK